MGAPWQKRHARLTPGQACSSWTTVNLRSKGCRAAGSISVVHHPGRLEIIAKNELSVIKM